MDGHSYGKIIDGLFKGLVIVGVTIGVVAGVAITLLVMWIAKH